MRRARIVTLERTCGYAPSQWEGRLDDGRAVFVHHRHGRTVVAVGTDIDHAVDNSLDGILLAEWTNAGEAPGFMRDDQVLHLLRQNLDLDDGLLDDAPGR